MALQTALLRQRCSPTRPTKTYVYGRAITNSGKIIGYVEIDNQAIVTVHGGTGKTFGTWIGGAINGGAITVGNGNLNFASGNTEVDENISVNGGAGTVTNSSVLRFAASEMINGDVRNNG